MTSKGALDYMADRLALVDAAAAALKCRVDEVPARVENLQVELRETSNKLKKALTGGSSDAISSSIEGAVELGGYKLVVAELQDLEAATCATYGIPCTRRSPALSLVSSPA